MIRPRLAREIEALNPQQRDAVLCEENIVVRAGPGAGKTRTLVAKVGYLLDVVVSKHQGVAAITYTRAAARELADRLEKLDIPIGSRLRSGTLHSWCLNHIVRPYGPLVGVPVPGQGGIVGDGDPVWVSVLQHCYDTVGLTQNPAYEKITINKLRGEIAAGQIHHDENTPTVAAARMFDQEMLARGLYDYDLIVAHALRIIEKNPLVTQLLSARHPWLVIDEYQDLGPVLHALVLRLQQLAPTHVAAFGDPDQSILGFAGADPRYMNELIDGGYEDHPLYTNYRSGRAIVLASQAALNQDRPYRADPSRDDPGIVDPVEVSGDLDDHALAVVSRVDQLVQAGVANHQIAIVYRGRGQLLDELIDRLDVERQPYVLEDDQRLPRGDVADFIRDCTARAIAGPQPNMDSAATEQSKVRTIRQLSKEYGRLRATAQMPPLATREIQRRLADVVGHPTTDMREASSLSAWLTSIDAALNLTEMCAKSREARDQGVLKQFDRAANEFGFGPLDIASGIVQIGKLVVTNYHRAKGREWDFVILPGLVDGIMPSRHWTKPNLTLEEMDEERRSFYVGLTRARLAVTLIYGSYWTEMNKYGRVFRKSFGEGISPFALDVLRSVADTE